MSMSQEEIEALMSGLDGPGNSDAEVTETPLLEDEAIEESAKEEEQNDSVAVNDDDIVALLDSDDTVTKSDALNSDIKDDIVDVLNEIDGMEDVDLSMVEDNILTESTELPSIEDLSNDPDFTEKAITWTEDKITKGEFPFPAEPSTKVVTQLSEVAQDNEEKAGQIFDVLSYILDENSVTQKDNKKIDGFLDEQIELLTTLSTKFPNIAVFNEHLQKAQDTKELVAENSKRLSNEDMKLFEAMEIMQFHDINRQKIERVMSVIRKLTAYLNNLFEEDKEYEEIAIAKHIHGDNTSDLVGAEDLDALIAEFNK